MKVLTCYPSRSTGCGRAEHGHREHEPGELHLFVSREAGHVGIRQNVRRMLVVLRVRDRQPDLREARGPAEKQPVRIVVALRAGEVQRDELVDLRTHDVTAIAGKNVVLCPECTKLLTHAFVKRTHCPMDPKPMCKHCPNHCYHPTYRQQIREVMKFSGRNMVFGGRLDYLFHLLF